ncbi:MAG: YkgJ family cysteine cluster protein [Bryobacteraceae bacterium]|nr:YkgJ family cysteine cluster protein [Bryobacteraceae bacterium]MCX7605580.1 YkgJ family cysteine cluster protein [Bryobacteraceae bacterium]
MDELRFACQPGCTRCCNQQGFVYLTEEDLRRAAWFLGLTPQQFERQFVYRTRHLLRLRKPRGRQCHFLLEDGCAIHPAKPTQCRLFPFWPELVESRRAWQQTARLCPGIGQGPLIQIGTALETASEMKQAYPGLYGRGAGARRRR